MIAYVDAAVLLRVAFRQADARVRQHRVIYQILDAELIVTIVKVGDRKDVYR